MYDNLAICISCTLLMNTALALYAARWSTIPLEARPAAVKLRAFSAAGWIFCFIVGHMVHV